MPKNTINRLLEIKTELGYIRDSDFAKFLEKQPADIDKYLSGGNLAALEEYRNKCADLQKENDRLKAKINKLENLNFALIEYVHNYLQTTNNLKHPANERTKKQPTFVKSG